MARCFRFSFFLASTIAIWLTSLSGSLFAQDLGAIANLLQTGPGGYLSLVKLFSIAAVFLIWVRMADWVNRDTLKIGERTGMRPEIWNPMVVFSFLIGFLLAISVPIFYAGFAIYAIAAFLPFTVFFFIRRGKLIDDPGITQFIKLKPGEIPKAEKLPQDEGAEIDIKPAGDDADAQRTSMIRARQTGAFSDMKNLLDLCQFKRADQLMMNFTRGDMSARILVDGFWHNLDPTERETADSLLASVKLLAGLNPSERRASQTGRFFIKSQHGKSNLTIQSQGVQTGERVSIKFVGAAKEPVDFSQLGMFPDMLDTIRASLDGDQLTIISAPPGSGLSTSWQGAIMTTDRLTRDCVGLIASDEHDTDLENVVIHRYDGSPGKTEFEILSALLLTQPDMLIVPKVEDSKTMDLLTEQVTKHQRSLALQTPAKSAAEALLRVYAQAGDREKFLQALGNVTCQRLVRRLCDDCKVEVRVQPNLIKQLGGDPRKQGTVFGPWRLPPPDQQVDEKGRPIDFPPCETCGGIGYLGRIAVFENISLNDQLRGFIKTNPKIPAIDQAATKLGKKPMIQQAYRMVLTGVTSVDEIKRVFK